MRSQTLLAILATVILAGCTSSTPPPNYDPGVTAADFVQGINNPFLPFKPGSTWVYEAHTDQGTERIEVTVLAQTQNIMGVAATAVSDTSKLNGVTQEVTTDWYAQDRSGNVWYLGEDTTAYEDGKPDSTLGTWKWGVDGALPGIAMKADPKPDSKPYFQEFYWGKAVDEASVEAVGHTVTVPAGTYHDTVTTKEWTRLHPDQEEQKDYARGVGMVNKVTTKGGPADQEVLVSFTSG